MRWTVNNISISNFEVITKLKLVAINSNQESKVVPIKSPYISNRILTLVVDSISTRLTESTGDNSWHFELYYCTNYSSDEKLMATSSQFTSKLNSTDISYKGINVVYIDLSELNWDGFIDILRYEAKDSSRHVINFTELHKFGVSKDLINSYVGNELNVNLHNQNS